MKKKSNKLRSSKKKKTTKNQPAKLKLLSILLIFIILIAAVLGWLFFVKNRGCILNESKVYDYENAVITEDVHIAVDGVILKNATIEGDLYVDASVGDGHVEIENVIAKGKTYIYGGGKDTVMVIGGRVYEALGEFNGRIHAINWASLDRIVVKSSDLIIKTDETSEVKKVELLAPKASVETSTNVELDGNFIEVKDNGENDITLKKGTHIETYVPLCMGSGCSHSNDRSTINMEEDTNIKKATINKPTTIQGDGSVDELNIQSDDVILDIEVEKIINEDEYSIEDVAHPKFVSTPARTMMNVETGDYTLSFEVNSSGTIYYILQPPTDITITTPTVAQVKNGEGNAVCYGPNCPPSVVSSKAIAVNDFTKKIVVSGYYGDSQGMRPEMDGDFDPSSTLFAVFENSKGKTSEVIRVEL